MNRQVGADVSQSSIRARLHWLILPFAFAVVVLLFLAALPARGQGNSETVIVRVAKADFGKAAGIEAMHTIDYDSYIWLELTLTQFAELQATGVDFVQPPRPTVLQFQGYRFDTHI